MTDTAPKKSGLANLAIDYLPILLFFAVYKYYAPADSEQSLAVVAAVVKGTIAFMVAALIALVVSLTRYKHVSPMLWLSTALIIGFGALTWFFNDPWYVQIKPTVIYLLFGISLLVGVAMRKPLLKVLLGAAFEGLDETGWHILSRNWGLCFLFFAGLNEVLRHFYNASNGGFGTWILLKAWLFMPLSFAFTFAHMPMLLRHGLASEEKDEAEATTPHE